MYPPNSSRVTALLVGIEQYDLGSAANLNGPSRAVCSMVDWLLMQNVPSCNLIVHVNPLAQNEAEVAARLTTQGIKHLPPTEDAIRDSVITTLRKHAGDLLIIYWCGHGFFEGDHDRRLFYSDATNDDWRNANLSELLRYLRSDAVSGFDHQVGFIDACAQFTEWSHASELPNHNFPAGKERTGQSQFLMLAASLADLALAPPHLPVPLFTFELLQQLQQTAIGKWPNLESVDRSLQDRFIELRASGETRQTPSRYYVRDWGGGVEALGKLATTSPRSIRARGWLSKERLEALLNVIPEDYLPQSLLSNLYRHSMPASAKPISDRSLSGILTHLADLPLLESTPPPLWQFVRHLADRLPPVRGYLEDWLQESAAVYPNVKLPTSVLQPAKQQYYVTVCVGADQDAEGRRIASIRSWKLGDIQPLSGGWDPDNPVTLDNVRENLIQHLERLLHQIPPGVAGRGSAEVIVEFCMPRLLLLEPVDQWPIPGTFDDAQPLGAEFPVVVRDIQRPARIEAQQLWTACWERLEKDRCLTVSDMYWVEAPGTMPPKELYNLLRPQDGEKPTFVCIAFSFMLKEEYLREEKSHCLYAPWQAGLPVALWLRRPLGCSDDVKKLFGRLFDGYLVEELPQRVRDLRRMAYDQSGGEEDIALVWDNPMRVPY